MNIDLSPEHLSALAGILLSVAFTYIPSVRRRWVKLDRELKRLIMLEIVIIAAVALYVISCNRWLDLYVSLTCDRPGTTQLVLNIVYAIAANQSIYGLSPRPEKIPPDIPDDSEPSQP